MSTIAKGKVTFSKWDIVDYLKTEEDIHAYLEVVAEENNPVHLVRALADVVRARDVNLTEKTKKKRSHP